MSFQEMTSRERMIAAMNCEDVDHLPCGPFGLARFDRESPIAQELIQKTDIFLKGLVGGDPVLGQRKDVTREEDGNVHKITIHTPSGDLVKRVKSTDVTQATIEHPLKDIDDVEKLLSVKYEEPEINAEDYFYMKENYGEQGIVLCPVGNAVSVPASWFGPEKFCIYWATERQKLVEFTQEMNRRLCDYVEKCCEAGVKDFRIVGGEYVTTQIGPSGMEDLIREPDKKLIDIIHAYDGIAFYHNHGPVMKFLEDFAYIGVDFLEPMEAPPWGDTHLGKAKEIIGGRYCRVGNLDDMEVINKLDTDEVKKIARERIEEAGTNGFVLSGTASGTYTEKGAKNFIAMAEVAAEYP